jgi:type III secretion protein U
LSEKTEKPTPKRLRDARKKGQVAKSKEIATCAVIVGLFSYLWFFADTYIEHLKYMIGAPAEYYAKPFEQALTTGIRTVSQELILLTLPFALFAAAIAALAYLLQIGFLVSMDPVKPDLKKINPVEGVKRIFSLNNLLELAKSVVKILLLGAIIFWLIKGSIKHLLFIPRGDLQTPLKVLGAILQKLVIAVSSLFIIIAIIDYFFQKHLHIRKLRMSKEDIKREYKDREGDPHFKRHRRRLQIEVAMDDVAARIKQSTVAIVDGERLAVVLYYEMGKTPVPILSAKGKNLMAGRITALARSHGLPIVSDAALARALYAGCDQGNYIGSDFIEPVALLLRKFTGLGGQQRP